MKCDPAESAAIDLELLRELFYAMYRRGIIDQELIEEVTEKFERLANHYRGSTRAHRYEMLAHRATLIPLEATTEDAVEFAAQQRRARIRAVPDGGKPEN